jgi:hypothetical protein
MSKTTCIVLIPAITALLVLSGCASGGPDSSGGDASSNAASAAPEETTAAAPETACPDGFVAAWGVAAAANYGPDFTFREATADEFQPAFLTPFLDGGCAIYATGTNLFAGFAVKNYYGFSPDADSLSDVTAALDKAGFKVADSSTPAFYNGPNGEFASAFAVGGDVHTDGDAAIVQYFPTGIVFY